MKMLICKALQPLSLFKKAYVAALPIEFLVVTKFTVRKQVIGTGSTPTIHTPAVGKLILLTVSMRIVGVDPGQTDMITYCVLGDHKELSLWGITACKHEQV